nr:protein kinase [Anaerolineae bacterium]
MTSTSIGMIGNYEILGKLGEGGFGVVYHARDPKLGREVAIKVLKPVWLGDPKAVKAFYAEAYHYAKLDHPHIIEIYDMGESDGQLYIVMRLVRGQTLRQRLQNSASPLSLAEAIPIIRALAQALDYAHSQKLIHRDLKPANILLRAETGETYLTDFGLARNDELASSLSGTSSQNPNATGTKEYISPEVWNNHAATAASDVYSLGCVIYEMLTGEILFSATTIAAIIAKHQQGITSDKLNKLDIKVRKLVTQALHLSPDKRLTMPALLQELQRIDNQQGNERVTRLSNDLQFEREFRRRLEAEVEDQRGELEQIRDELTRKGEEYEHELKQAQDTLTQQQKSWADDRQLWREGDIILEQRVAEQTQAKEQFQAKVAELNNRLGLERQTRQTFERQLAENIRERDELQRNNDALTQRMADVEQRRKQAEQGVAHDLAQYQARLGEFDAERKLLTRLLAEESSKLQQVQTQVQGLQTQLTQAQQASGTAQNHAQTAETRSNALQNQLDDESKQRKQTQAQLVALQTRLSDIQAQAQTVTETLRVAQASLAQAQLERDQALAQVKTLNAQLVQAERLSSARDDELKRVLANSQRQQSEQVTELTRQLGAANQANATLEKERDQLKQAQQKAAEQAKAQETQLRELATLKTRLDETEKAKNKADTLIKDLASKQQQAEQSKREADRLLSDLADRLRQEQSSHEKTKGELARAKQPPVAGPSGFAPVGTAPLAPPPPIVRPAQPTPTPQRRNWAWWSLGGVLLVFGMLVITGIIRIGPSATPTPP